MLVATQREEGWLRGVLRPAGSGGEARARMELLEFVGIARLAHEPAANLSYGQRKLLELASLLVADPAVLLLDEPAGGVNPTLITHLADRIRELNRAGKTFLVVEHNMEFVMGLCHRVTVLSQGRRSSRARRPRCARTPRCSTPTWAARTTPPQLELAAAPAHRRRAHRRCRADIEPRERLGATAPLLSVAGVDRRLRRRRHPQAASRSRCPKAGSPASSAPTAPASRRCWRPSAACCGRARARSGSPASRSRGSPRADPGRGHRAGPAGAQPVPAR